MVGLVGHGAVSEDRTQAQGRVGVDGAGQIDGLGRLGAHQLERRLEPQTSAVLRADPGLDAALRGSVRAAEWLDRVAELRFAPAEAHDLEAMASEGLAIYVEEPR